MKEESTKEKNIKSEIINKTVTLMLAGLGLVAALAWNDAIQSLVNLLFPLQKNTVMAKFFYAFLITAGIVIVSMRLKKIKANN